MVKIVSGTKGTNKWLPPNWRRCTFPILNQPAKTIKDISGSAFLLYYKHIPYIVTAGHVVEIQNPVIAFTKKNREVLCVSSSQLQQVGLKWIKHPAGFDLAATPFHLPLSRVRELDVTPIVEDQWNTLPKIKVKDEIAHLGYPEKGTSRYLDELPCLIPQAMPGKIIQINRFGITMATAGAHGASGGPVFLKRQSNNPRLIGIVTDATVYGKSTRPAEGEYRSKTKALVIWLIKDVLESKEMKKQFDNRWIGEDWF